MFITKIFYIHKLFTLNSDELFLSTPMQQQSTLIYWVYILSISHLHDECHFSFSKNNIVFVQRNVINIFNNLFKRWHGRMNQLNEINHTLISVSYNLLKDIILVQIINKTSVVISFKCHNIIKHKKSHLDDVFVRRVTFYNVAIVFLLS